MEQAIISIHKLLSKAVERFEIVAALLVLGVVFMMIMPLPTLLVDALIATNISISLLLVVFAMYLPGALSFSTFPSVLLITTLFRLALSITTTRLILLEGDAGSIVETFGEFVVGGNLAVGLVIFLILTIVQFLVITKGSERVAEVAARFTLDAMPGKQMSIDSDLRAGLINASQARQKRESLAKESQLFGALDGAMKFVKGDAIAGLVIVAVNLIGGFAVGVLQHQLPAGEAIQTYSILTIGDGLVAQIPALLISLTAGIIITRVNTQHEESNANVGREMAEQILSQPRAWLIAAFATLGFSIIPGMPTLVFILLAIVMGALGYVQLRSNAIAEYRRRAIQKAPTVDAYREGENGDYDIRRFDPARPYVLILSKAVKEKEHTQFLIRQIRRRRNLLVTQYGMTLPNIDIEYHEESNAEELTFCVYEVPTLALRLRPQMIALRPWEEFASQLQLNEQDMERDEAEPSLIWIPGQYETSLREAGIPYELDTQVVSRRMEMVFLKTGAKFIGIQETHVLVRWLESDQPELAKELQRVLPTARLTEVLQNLAAERVSLRSIRPIVETLVEWGPREKDTTLLTEYVRIALRNQICHQCSDNHVLYALLLTPETEETLRETLRRTSEGGFLALTPEITRQLLQHISRAITESVTVSQQPVLITTQDLRRFIRQLIENDFFHLPVLSYSEITPDIQVQPLQRIGL